MADIHSDIVLIYLIKTAIWLLLLDTNTFFWASGENHQYDESRPRYIKRERKTVSDFYWLKTPPAPSIAPGAKSAVCRLNGSCDGGRQLARYRASPRYKYLDTHVYEGLTNTAKIRWYVPNKDKDK